MDSRSIRDLGGYKWKLVRERDGLTKRSMGVYWIDWTDDGELVNYKSEPLIGRSLIMSPFGKNYTWMTTVVTEILEQSENFIKFKTLNSNYLLTRINSQNKN